MKLSNKKMIMNSLKKLSVVLLAVVVFANCDDFGDINVDPNNPSAVKTELLFTSALRSISGDVGAVTGTLYVQYISETQYNEAARYQTVSFDFSGYYTGELKDLQTIIDLNTDDETKGDVITGGSNANQIATARIMKAYFYHIMTDRWGGLPYSEALQGDENFSPAYDDQQSIYAALVTELEEAVAQMDGGLGPTGDILFDGDMTKWAQFANTLRAKIALRMSGVNAATAKSVFEDAVSDGLITEDVMYPYLAESANQNPWYARFITRTDYAISDVLADTMISLSDMRVTAYADPAPDADDGDGVTELSDIVGLEYHISDPGAVTNDAISFPGQAIRAQDAGLPIVTMAEVHFALAEAANNGWSVGGTAQGHYEAGIDASWAQWGVTGDGTALAAYKATPEVAFNAGTAMDQIAFQKWVALYPNGYEAWAEWRRLDSPALTPHPDALNVSGQIPLRHGYPASEAQLNEASYNAAVSAQGTDDEATALWWDN